jgi:hypothetical protein
MNFILHPDPSMGMYFDVDEWHGRREWVFPLTDDNPNTAGYLAWVADGNTAEEWSPQ